MRVFTIIYDFLKSLKLAVIVIVSLAVISAVGTVYEAKYDAFYAQQMVYHSIYMYITLALLCINLIAVMVDRWPWQKRHTGFVMAHIGIILILIGAIFTQRWGVDGSMTFEIGGNNRFVTVPDRLFAVYSSFDGNNIRELHSQEVNFLKRRPTEEKPYRVHVGSEQVDVVEYHHFAMRETEIVASEKEADGPAIRFQLANNQVNFAQWLRREANRPMNEVFLGPARVVLADKGYQPVGGNEMVLWPVSETEVGYRIYREQQGSKPTVEGVTRLGEAVATGWMDLEFRLLRYLPRAREDVRYAPQETPSDFSNSAIKIRYDGEEHWLGLNSVLRLYAEDKMYMVSYANRRIDIGFEMRLKDFRIGRYQGTLRAASYESDVEVPGLGVVNISMNEPLKFNGYTFYQASFEEDEAGEAVASILSVNYDPGRPLKYLGSLMLVLGSIILFYFKKTLARKKNLESVMT